MTMTQDIIGLLLDYLDIRPKSTVLEVGSGEPIFASEFEKREISYTKTEKSDWIIYVVERDILPSITSDIAARQVIVVPHALSLTCYIKWCLSLPIKEIIRIKPATNSQALYMSSTNFWETLKRTYKEANLNIVGKCLVAIKVALTPPSSYPMLVLVL